MFDAHAHLCFPDFDNDREAVVSASKQQLKGVLVSSAQYEEGKQVLDLVKKHQGFLWASIGHHPIQGDHLTDTLQLIRDHAPQLKAIGEVGLDHHWESDPEKQAQQKQVFQQFIDLARELKKPLVIHSWDAEEQAFEMIKDSGVQAVFHCFTGKPDLGLQIAEAGHYVSLSTNLLFSKRIRKTGKALPLDKLLLETDSPFLDPDRERKHNTPANVLLTAKKIAELRNSTPEEIAQAAWTNAKHVFLL